MTVAALYDVHANLPALEAVLADGAADADAVVFGGDLVAGAWPRETLDLARSLGDRAHFVRGNWERYVVEEPDEPVIAWLRERIDPSEVDWPSTLSLDGVLYCHATPRRDDELVLPQVERSPWEAFDVDEPLVVCGHTHLQFDAVRHGRRIVNPGSVGAPTVRAAAWWALIGDDVELRTTSYDTDGTAAAMGATGWEWLGFADGLRAPPALATIVELVEGSL
jgi:predicted phosphodiesterase